MTTLRKDSQNCLTKKNRSILVDMTSYVGADESVMRIEIHGTRDPVIGKAKTLDRKIVNPDYIIGLLKIGELPIKGSVFRMPYHNVNGLQSFGTADSLEPVVDIARSEDKKYIYFTTSTGEWRLELLNSGN